MIRRRARRGWRQLALLGSIFLVLCLLADLFQFRLEADDDVADRGGIRLGADRVDLAVHLLHQEIQLAPHRFLQAQGLVELGKVAVETHQLLGDVAAVGEERDLAQHPLVVDLELDDRRRGADVAQTDAGEFALCADGGGRKPS